MWIKTSDRLPTKDGDYLIAQQIFTYIIYDSLSGYLIWISISQPQVSIIFVASSRSKESRWRRWPKFCFEIPSAAAHSVRVVFVETMICRMISDKSIFTSSLIR